MEPVGAIRSDWQIASIVAALYNLHRNREKHPDPFPISQWVMKWGDEAGTTPAAKPAGKTWQQLKLIGQVMAASYNMMEEEDQKKRRRKR